MITKNNAGYTPEIEDVPNDLDGEIRLVTVSDCCNAGIYTGTGDVTCLNCMEECGYYETVVIGGEFFN